MNFKEALIAHLQGEKVECRYKPNPDRAWESFLHEFGDSTIACVDNDSGLDDDYEFRLAPRTIIVNGVEVPAPEKEAPSVGSVYYIPCVSIEEMYKECVNHCKSIAKRHADMDIIYLNKEDAIARAKAMLIVKEG